MTIVEDMEIRALNDAESSENKIHSDDIASKYGFSGALVSGVNIFGYLTQPLVRHFGGTILERSTFDVKFLKPAYHDELLRISTEEIGAEADKMQFKSSVFNQAGILLAILESSLWKHAPPIGGPHPALQQSAEIPRSEISWDRINISVAAPDFLWTPSEEDNRVRVDAQRDTASIYQGTSAYIHPYYLLDACNKALMRMFILPAWIHVGSTLSIKLPIRIGQEITVRTVPIEKWQSKGHQFIRLSIAMITQGKLAAETTHTAIFNIAS